MSIRRFNVWIGVSATVRQAVDDFVADPENNTPANPDNERIVRFLARTVDRASVDNIFNNPQDFGGTDYWMFSVYYDVATAQGVQGLADELDWIIANGGTDVSVLGAWYASGPRNGLQGGQEYQFDSSGEIEGITGTPRWPINDTVALRFMPDIVTHDQDGNETSRTPATVLTDVNLRTGQEPRNFDV